MPIKRRNFVGGLLVSPAVPAALGAQQTTPSQTTPSQPGNAQQTTPQQQPQPQPNTPARQEPRQPQEIPTLKVTEVDVTAATEPHYFSADQFAALRKLGAVLMPPLKGNPGALDAQAPEFLDFLISVSPGNRQKLYRNGLDGLNAHANAKFGKPFADLDPQEVDAILRPLLVVRYWPEDLPKDPMQNFVAQVHEDLRTATMNSREWAAVAAKSGHRFTRGFRGSGLYWAPIDPISEG